MSGRVGPLKPSFINTYSLDFDGVDDYIDCGDVWDLASEPYTWSPFTLSFWYKGTNPIVGAVHYVSLLKFAPSQFLGLYDGYTGAANLKLYFNFAGQFNIGWTVGSNGTIDLFDDQWHNVTIVFPPGSNDGVDATNTQMYIDNTLITKVGSGIMLPPTLANTWDLFQIMEGEWSPLGGLVDELALWKTDETSNVEAIYNGGTPTDLTPLNPLAWYRMGDNGAYKDPQWLIPSNENKDKVSNYSIEFDGVDSKMDVANNTTIGRTQNISYSIWVNLVSTTTRQYIVGNGGSSNRGTRLSIETISGNALVFQIGDSTNDSFFNSRVSNFGTLATPGTWNHILATWDGIDAKIYINGNLENTFSPALPYTIVGWDPFRIGYRVDGFTGEAYKTNGKLDEISLFDTAISISDVWDGSGRPIDASNVSGITNYWKMGENATFTYDAIPDGTWVVPDEVGTSNATTNNLMADSARVGSAPSSSNNALSFNMDLIDRVEDTPPS